MQWSEISSLCWSLLLKIQYSEIILKLMYAREESGTEPIVMTEIEVLAVVGKLQHIIASRWYAVVEELGHAIARLHVITWSSRGFCTRELGSG